MTTEIINELFGIKESFELPQALLAKLLDKAEKDKLCKEFVKQGFNGNNDCLRDYFQENNANRSNLKQDYTPDCLCKLISKLAPKSGKIIDICAGTGALSVGMDRDSVFQCEELSQMSIPVLLLNLVIRNKDAIVVQKNVLLNEVQKVYKLCKSDEFSDIEVVCKGFEQAQEAILKYLNKGVRK